MSDEIVHIVDDDEDMRSSLDRLLRAKGFTVRAYSSAGDFLVAPRLEGGGCLILDLRMPGGPGGLELQEKLESDAFPLPIIFLTAHGTVETGVRAMKSGAFDFLTKPVEPDLLVRTVRAALERDRAGRGAQTRIAEMQARYKTLSAREREVFASIVTGQLNKRVGADLGISERTVKMHRAHVMQKMKAGSIAELVQIADFLQAARRPDEPHNGAG
jgi:FixJ family two-component response regulator